MPEQAANTDAELFEDFVSYFSVLNKHPKSLRLLYKVLKNLAENPGNEKFRKLKHGNKLVR